MTNEQARKGAYDLVAELINTMNEHHFDKLPEPVKRELLNIRDAMRAAAAVPETSGRSGLEPDADTTKIGRTG